MNHPKNVVATFEVLQKELDRVLPAEGESASHVMCAIDIQYGYQYSTFARPLLFVKKLQGRKIKSVSADLGPGDGQITLRVELENDA